MAVVVDSRQFPGGSLHFSKKIGLDREYYEMSYR